MNHKLFPVLKQYEERLRNGLYEPCRADTSKLFEDRTTTFNHLLWMTLEAQAFLEAGRVEKAMRWLGFIQGCFAALGEYSIDELSEHNR